MFVLTVDQVASTSRGDRVPALLAQLGDFSAAFPGLTLPFERTVGDEVQGVFSGAEDALATVRKILRLGDWSIGLGIGEVHTPLPAHSRAAAGPAFVHARDAVQRAKVNSTLVPLAVSADDADLAGDLEALLRLVGAVIAKRTAAGWEVVDLLGAEAEARTQQDVAEQLQISRQAVNQRLRTTLWAEEVAVVPLAQRLMKRADA